MEVNYAPIYLKSLCVSSFFLYTVHRASRLHTPLHDTYGIRQLLMLSHLSEKLLSGSELRWSVDTNHIAALGMLDCLSNMCGLQVQARKSDWGLVVLQRKVRSANAGLEDPCNFKS